MYASKRQRVLGLYSVIVFVAFLAPLMLLGDGVQAKSTCKLTWIPPQTNADQTPLTDLAGYFIYVASGATSYNLETPSGQAGPLARAKSCRDLGVVQPGTYRVTMAAFDTSGNISELADEVVFKITKKRYGQAGEPRQMTF